MSNTDVFDDAPNLVDMVPEMPEQEESPTQPLYRIFEGSRVAVGKATGEMWRKQLEASMTAYEHIHNIWEECFKYYNNDQQRGTDSPVGPFTRGDGTENIIFSNINIMLPAVYSKDPDITCSTTDEADEPFCNTAEAVVNTLFKSRGKLNAKPKIKRGTGMGLLTNCGVLKLDFTKKDDSREFALSEMQRITEELAKAKDQQELDKLYGELDAVEQNMEVLQPSGFSLTNVLPHNLIVDPYAEQSDGMDARWMMERVFILTSSLMARYTKKANEDDEEADDQTRVLVYKPTHKAVFAPGQGGGREDGMGLVLQAFDQAGGVSIPTSHTDEERLAYINMWYTECYYVWDKATRRVFLFHRDDWTWPLWVWDDPLQTTRFFPYFIISFSLSTGGTVSPGEMAYILDQQDEINDINREKSKIRRAVFDFFFYNSDKVDQQQVEKFVSALRGKAGAADADHLVGVKAGELPIDKIVSAVAPPAAHYDTLFDKAPVLEAINRITNTSDALRGTQFKTNTNTASVKSYEQSMRISVGAKVDVVEDTVADIASAILEIAVQNWDQQEVEGLVGKKMAEGWREMSLEEFHSTYNVEVVAGSMEKPTSSFKKQEAIEVTQAVGQFAQAAPASTLIIMLRMLEKAFTEVVIKPEDWDMIKMEVMANVGGQQQQPAPGSTGGGQVPPEEIDRLKQAASQLPPEDQQQVIQMAQNGSSGQDILTFVQQRTQEIGAGNNATQEPGRRQRRQRR